MPDAPQHKPKLLTALRANLRVGHYSLRTESAYLHWARRFIRYHGLQHPAGLGVPEVTEFIRHLAEDRHAAASTQTQALAALLFLYREVLRRPLALAGALPRARTPTRIPTVLTRDEVDRVLAQLSGTYRLVGLMLYGSGMRLTECVTLRVKDLDLVRGEIRIRHGKGAKDRVTVLPDALKRPLGEHLQRVKARHVEDLARGAGRVELPGAFGVKAPSAKTEWAWQWVFPASRVYMDGATGERRRHHIHQSAMQRAMGQAVPKGRDRQARELSHAAPLVCNSFVGGRVRHQDVAGAAWAQGCDDDDGLHARAEPEPARGEESLGLGWGPCEVPGLDRLRSLRWR